MRRWKMGWLCVLVLGTLLGCADRGTSMVAARLQQCGHLGEGRAPALPFYMPTLCYQQCLSHASCEELSGALCGEVDLLIRCDAACAYRCGDGSLQPVEVRCDGVTDCADGRDELGCESEPSVRTCVAGELRSDCELFECTDGRTLGIHEQCNGYAGCADGSDEEGCYRCGDDVYAPDDICDGWSRCSNGADERDCAELTRTCG